MNPFKAYGTNLELEEIGAKMVVGLTAYAIVARAGNKQYKLRAAAAMEKNSLALGQNTPESEELAEELLKQVEAETVLLGWGVFEDDDGQPLEYSVSNARRLLNVKDFRKQVSAFSNNYKNYQDAAEAADAKN